MPEPRAVSGRTPSHPIVAQMEPSVEQEPAIWERGCDVVVTAGAGSGKTRTLVARYLALLAEGCPLRRAIAITFTEKAAREMRNRVRDEIRRYLEAPGLPEPERARWQNLYSELDAARIGTIHGLCAEILRSHPAEAAVDPRFAVLSEGQANLLCRRAVNETLAWAAELPDVVSLFGLLGERGLRETLDTLLRRRLDAAAVYAGTPADLLGRWRAVLAARQAASLAGLRASESWQHAAAVVVDEVGAGADDRMELQRSAAAAALQRATDALAAQEPASAAMGALSELDAINLRGGSATAWPGGSDQLGAVKSALGMLRGAWRGAKILHQALGPSDEALADAAPRLRACFDFMCARYAALKRERQALDFDDLEAEALALLETNAAVRARWQAEAAALLVDEFQDTNDRQRRLVRCLNLASALLPARGDAPGVDGGKLFIVGDAKQSIYRFRGADVTVFREERERIAREGGAVLPLATSYRAHCGLLEGLNDLLRPVLGEEADPARPWVEPFARLHPYRQAAGSGFTPPHIELHLALGSKSQDGLDRAADALAARLATMVESQAFHIDVERGVRPLEYGDVAILCRASTSFAAYENALERAGIPFLTVAGRGFYGRPEIRDLLNALTALADPTDDLALAGLLRSPALALSDVALYRLAAAGRGEAFPDEIAPMESASSVKARTRGSGAPRAAAPPRLWDLLRDVGATLPGEEGARAARAVDLISELNSRAGRAPVADLIKAFLDATGYRAALLSAGEVRAARNVDKLLVDAHASGLVGVGDFLEYVAELRDSGTREGEARTTPEGAVQIMSVHAAKGLEFPLVVVGDVTYRSPQRDGILLDSELGILLPRRDDDKALPSVYRLAKLVADDQEAAESDRLLYVAATRAREKLIISGCITTKADGTPAAPGGWLGRMSDAGSLRLSGLDLSAAETAADPLRFDASAGNSAVAGAIYGPAWAPAAIAKRAPLPEAEPVVELPPPLLAPAAAEPVSTDDRTAERERDPDQRVWRVVPAKRHDRAPGWVVGKLVHEALAAWRFPDDAGQLGRWIEAQARSYGLTDPRQLSDAERSVRKLLLRFQAHPLYAEMASAEPLKHEVPYSRRNEDGQVENGVVDALYLRDGSWTIVEFKTDRIPDRAGLDRLPMEKHYLPQARRYQAAVEQLVGQRPRVVFCFLDCVGEIYLHSLD
jgi:ATP-dependent helicase/nuclease subunit A